MEWERQDINSSLTYGDNTGWDYWECYFWGPHPTIPKIESVKLRVYTNNDWPYVDSTYGSELNSVSGYTKVWKAKYSNWYIASNYILLNPGFEDDMSQWTQWTSGTSGTNEIVTTNAHTGIKSLHLLKTGYTSGAFGVSSDTYNATPGSVALKLWAKGSKSGTVYLKIQAYNASNGFLGTGQFSLGDVESDWGQQTFTWTYPANTAKTKLDIAVQCNEDLYIDDIELYKT
jgi:hypothetical protein